MTELDLVVETGDMLRIRRFLNGVVCHQDLVHTLHRGQTLGDVVTCLREIFQGVDDGVEHHHIVDEDGA